MTFFYFLLHHRTIVRRWSKISEHSLAFTNMYMMYIFQSIAAQLCKINCSIIGIVGLKRSEIRQSTGLLVRWDKWLVDQASDVPSIIFFSWFLAKFFAKMVSMYLFIHGLRTPNEGINQRYLKNWADVADKICCRHT